MGIEHIHDNGSNYECPHPQCKASNLVSSSVEDMRCSLKFECTDMIVLLHALLIVKRRKEKTKVHMIEVKIKKMILAEKKERKLRLAQQAYD